MIEVITFMCERIDTAEAPDPESALVAGRTLYDDAIQNIRGASKKTVTVGFYVDGKLSKMVEGRP